MTSLRQAIVKARFSLIGPPSQYFAMGLEPARLIWRCFPLSATFQALQFA
jgi:hypothetical protein